MDVQGMPGLASRRQVRLAVRGQGKAPVRLARRIGAKIDPDIPVAPGLHRAHLRGYFIGGDNAAIYTTPRA
jgi:hypothetical protein